MSVLECRTYRTGIGVLCGLVLFGASAMPATAGDAGCPGCPSLTAEPFAFVGAEGDCGALPTGDPYPAGSNIVTAAWLCGMGLPDNGGDNVGLLPYDNPNKQDPHVGLLLNKNGTTPDCSASGATIQGVYGIQTGLFTEIGYDYRNGGHCGAGAPRFNVVVQPLIGPETFHFVGGCSNDTAPAPAPQDPLQWTRVRFGLTNPAEAYPPILPGSTIVSIDLIYDEGTDTPTVQDPMGVGLAVVDNIFIVDTFIRSGTGVTPPCDDWDGDGACDPKW
jgi:hypothetical protein